MDSQPEVRSAVVIDDALLLSPESGFVRGRVVAEAGIIRAAGPGAEIPAGAEVVAGAGRRLTPGLVDLHVHGVEHFLFEEGPEELLGAARCFARYGTTTVLPGLVPRSGPEMLNRIAAVAGALERAEGVNLPGLHLEGPFLALSGAGCDTVPGDVGLLEELLAAGAGRVRVMSISPDTPHILPVIERLMERGVVPFVTHTAASLEQARAALAAGARHATHFYDAFPLPPERDPGVRPPGVVELYLADPRATVDFIADGCHVDPLVIQLAVQAKGSEGVACITDGVIGAGLPPGEYPTPWGHRVRVAPGQGARIADPGHPQEGGLSGSALTMNVGIANLLQWLDLPAEQVWALGTANPARIAGLEGVGTLAVGARADLVLWNEDLTPAAVWVAGVEQELNSRGD
jgi:N-acetylglucosamine-6-phosphate deacetylase